MTRQRYHHNYVRLQLSSADINGALQQYSTQQIALYDVLYIDTIHLIFSISVQDFSLLQALAHKRGDTLEIVQRQSIGILLMRIIKRPVMLLGMLALFFLSVWLPSRVLFLRIEGNVNIPTMEIIEQARHCGIQFGASRRQVRNEVMKNRLLSAMPTLQWAGITTSGCTAVITVQERNIPAESNKTPEFQNVVAKRDAVVGQIVVQKGTALCKPGQAVQEGQVLVSPYEDCGICIRATGALAEVYGQTARHLSTICPVKYSHRDQIQSITKKYSLIIGKNRIKFYKGSGISDGSCAKIYEENYITLPGGFVLPIAIAYEQVIEYTSDTRQSQSPETILKNFADQYLLSQMQAGKVLQSNENYSFGDDFCRLDGLYHCYELIARPEENRKTYE